jgi:MFS family permease
MPDFSMPNLAIYAGLIAALVASLLVLGIILMYVGSVMRFILFDSVLAGECKVGEGWSRRQGPGFRYFVWKLLYVLASLAFFAVVIGIPAAFTVAGGWYKEPGEHLAPLILGGILLFLVVVIFSLVAAVVFVLTKDFVVPQMALEGVGVFEGWRRLWGMMNAEKGDYAIYIVMKIVMAIVAAVVIGVAGLILAVFFVVPTAILGVVGVVAGKSAGLTWNAGTITLAVVVGCIFLFCFLYLVSLVSVPAIVFFPAYSIYFFAGRYPALSRALYPAPPVPVPAMGTTPFGQPPPLPPGLAPIG